MAPIPFVKDFDFSYEVPQALTPLVTRIIANNPGPFTYTGSGTYIIGNDGEDAVAVIDPGPDLDSHIDALARACADRPVSHILVTHTHRDHCGGAQKFADACGAPIYAFGPHPVRRPEDDAPALDEGGDHGFQPDELLADNDVINGPGWTLRVVHTPGHLSNHLCFALDEEKALFTGDHVMGWATTVVAPPDGNMASYMDSLDVLLARDDAIYYPTHGAPIPSPHRFVRAVKTHRRIRDGQIIEQLKSGRHTIRDMVPVMYADIDKRLYPAAALNVLAHLIRLVDLKTVVCDGPPEMTSTFRLA